MIALLTGVLIGAASWALIANVLAPVVGWVWVGIGLAVAVGIWGYVWVNASDEPLL